MYRMPRRLKDTLEDREHEAEEASCRSDAGQCDVEGYRNKKMVTPVARREAVAHLRAAFEVSERRACTMMGADRTSIRYRVIGRTIPLCVCDCGNWPRFAGGSAIGGCTSCSVAKASP